MAPQSAIRMLDLAKIPVDPLEACAACGHGWIHHLALASANASDPFRKGLCIPTACGGFWPKSASDSWTFAALCVCGQPWTNHEVLEALGNSTPPVGSSQALPPPPSQLVPPPLGLLQPSLANPVTTFSGLTSSGSASANDNRNAAIARHFPKPKYKPPRPFPSSSTASLQNFQALIALWPNTLPRSPQDSDTLHFAYTIDEFTEMLLRLKAHHLVFVATLPSADPSNIVQELDSQLAAHLSLHNLVPPLAAGSGDGDSAVPWFRRPWGQREQLQ
ncbi:hypothetical protein B0H13DRAFT_2306057 [Mycena leptocephala]|nr:hypothetical protein B0H13DRAFT_2306057 [Mycena leptocephala]